MNFKHNLKYFTARFTSKLAFACWVVAALGAIAVFVGDRSMYFIGGSIAVAAVVAGIVLASYSMRDSEYDEMIAELSAPFQERFHEFVNADLNKHNLHGREVIAVDLDRIYIFEGYLFDVETMVRTGSDGVCRSSKRYLTIYTLDKNTVYIGSKLQNMIADNSTESFEKFAISDISSVSLFRPQDISPLAGYSFVKFSLKNGEEREYPFADNAELDVALSQISNAITKAAEQ